MSRSLLSFRPGALSPVVGYPRTGPFISRASGKQSGGAEPADDDGQRSRQLAGE